MPELVQLDAAAIPELAGLAVATLPYDDCSPTLLRYTFFSGPEVDPGLTLGLKEDGRLVAVAIGIVTPGYQGGIWGHVKLVATVPSHQRRGHAARLLKTLEEAFVSKGATLAIVSFAQRYYVPGVDLRYSKALCLFDRLGYQRDHFTYNLAVDLQHRSFDLAPLQVRLAEEGITVRRIEQVDHDRFQQYMSERWNPGWQSEAMQSLDPERDPAPGHIALLDQEIVGFSVYDISRPGWLGPIGTNKELRGRDVGTALLHACLYDWQRSGRHYGEIAGIGPLYFYVTSCDAVICRAFQQYSKQLA